MNEEKATPKQKVIPKHDKELFPAVAHLTIVRPRFLRGYGINESKETWVTKVINEKAQTIDVYSSECFGKVESMYKEFLKKY